MKIAFQFYDYADYAGGPTINALRLLSKLAESNHTIHALVLYTQDYPNARKLQNLGIKCHICERMHYTEDQVKWYARIISEIQPDIFVANTSTSASFLAPYLRKAGIPIISTHRTPDPTAQSKAVFFATHPIYKHDAIVCVSSFLEKELQKHNTNNLITEVIPSGVPLSIHFADQSKPSYSFVYAGRFMERPKRLTTMLEAVAELYALNPNVSLTMVGGYESEVITYSKKAENLGIQNIVECKPKLGGDLYKKELSKHRFILLFSEFEGMPGAIMDGMSCGLIPIVANFHGIDELVKHGKNGFIIKNLKDDFKNLIIKIQQDNYNLKSIAANAIATIDARYSINAAAEKWIYLFERLSSQKTKKQFIIPTKIKLPSKKLRLYGDFRKPTLLEKVRYRLKIRTRIFKAINRIKHKLS
ncbi:MULTISPECIES: glycosyltransferase family 4 protein [unclassified Carboxylicivirga]|uniref:glycosyltransferase family 4 protein n=1 Tax=Carboxylicivirga TaxID=1628153 RepID=UPI003D34047A